MKNVFVLFLLFISLSMQAQELMPYRDGNLWGFYDRLQNKIVSLTYQETKPFRSGIARVKQNGKWGVVNTQLITLIPLQYDDITYLDSNTLKCRTAHLTELYNISGVKLYHESFREVTPMRTNPEVLVVENVHRKFGVITRQGKVVIPLQYVYTPAHIRKNLLLTAVDSPAGPLFGALNPEGKTIIPFQYAVLDSVIDESNQKIYVFGISPKDQGAVYNDQGEMLMSGDFDNIFYVNGDFIVVERNGKKGVKHPASALVWFDEFYGISQGIASGKIEGKACFINPDGKLIVLGAGLRVVDRRDNSVRVVVDHGNAYDNPCGLFDLEGNELLPVEYMISQWNANYAVVNIPGRAVCLLDIKSRQLVLPYYSERIEILSCGNIIVKKDKKIIMLNPELKEINGISYDNLLYATWNVTDRDRIYVSNSSKGEQLQGFISCEGQELLSARYSDIKRVTDLYGKNTLREKYIVRTKDSAALINAQGQFLTPIRKGYIESYHDRGYLRYGYSQNIRPEDQRNYVGVMDTSGKIILSPVYDGIEVKAFGIVVLHNGRYGYCTFNGQQLVPCEYYQIEELGTQYLVVKLFNKYGIWNAATGRKITETKYDKVFREDFETGVFKVELDGVIFYVDKEGREYVN